MKSIKLLRVLTYTAIAVTLLLQGIWMINAYQLIERQVSSLIRDVFNISVYKELRTRMNTPFSISPQMESNIIFDSAEDDTFSQEIDFNKNISTILQEHLSTHGQKLSLQKLDSIFHSEISQQKLNGKFIINRLNPETGEVLETTDTKGVGLLQGGLASEIIPIQMDGREGVQVLLLSPYRTVFRQMIFALILSLLLLLFVTYSLFFLLRSFTKERHLRQLQNDFSHALTHNMASPLQTIYQVNALLKDDRVAADTEKRNKYIDLAQQQIINLQALTDRILTVARAEQSPLSPTLKPTDIIQIIRQLVDKFSIQTKKEARFSTCFQPDTILFNVDEAMLYNAISNLIDNSIKYSGETVEIEIDCRLKKNGLHIGVKDNGYGISSANLQTIFNKFERGEAVKRKQATGFGLGLSYVKSVAEAHHGTVNLYSKKGEGTLFELFFPFEEYNLTNA